MDLRKGFEEVGFINLS